MRFCWPQLTFIAVVVILGIGSMLSGCGKKGPLYLPEPKAATKQEAEAKAKAKPPPQDETSSQPVSSD